MKLTENTDYLLIEEGVYMKNRELESRCHVSVLFTKKFIFILPGTFFKEYTHYFTVPIHGKPVETNEPIGLIRYLLSNDYQDVSAFENHMLEITEHGKYRFNFERTLLRKCNVFGLFAAGLKIIDEHQDRYIIGLNKRSNKSKYLEFHKGH
jgi:hypothetical protein